MTICFGARILPHLTLRFTPQIQHRLFSSGSQASVVEVFAGYSQLAKISCLIYQCMKIMGLRLGTPTEEILQLDKHWKLLPQLPQFEPMNLDNMLGIIANQAITIGGNLSCGTQDISGAVWRIQPSAHPTPFSSGYLLDKDMELGREMLAERVSQPYVVVVEHGAYTGDWGLKIVDAGIGNSRITSYRGFDINRFSLQRAVAATYFFGFENQMQFGVSSLDAQILEDGSEEGQQIEASFKVISTIEQKVALRYLKRMHGTLNSSGLACVSFALPVGSLYEANRLEVEKGHRTMKPVDSEIETFYHKPDFGDEVTDEQVVAYLNSQTNSQFSISSLEKVITNTYYSVESFTKMARTCGLEIVDIQKVCCNDNQYRATAVLKKG